MASKLIRFALVVPRRLPKSVSLFFLKVVGAGLAFVTNVIVARLVPQAVAGIYFGLLSAVTLLYAVGRYGLGYSTAKLVAAANAQGDTRLVGATMYESVRIVKAVSSAVTVLASVILGLAVTFGRIQVPLFAAAIMVLSITPFSIGSILMEGIRGLRRSLEFGILDSVVFKMSVLIGLSIGGYAFGLEGLVFGYLVGVVSNAFIAKAALHKIIPKTPNRNLADRAHAARLQSITRYLGIVSIATVAVQWTPTFIVSTLLPSHAAAVYFASFRTAAVLEFIVLAANIVVGPELVHAASLHGVTAMRKAAKKAAVGTLGGTLVLALPIFLFAPQVMLLYGPHYVVGSSVLRTLVIGQLLAAPLSFGLPALIAAGQERLAAITSAVSAVVGAVAIAAGTALYGSLGAALGQACASVLIAGACTAAIFGRLYQENV